MSNKEIEKLNELMQKQTDIAVKQLDTKTDLDRQIAELNVSKKSILPPPSSIIGPDSHKAVVDEPVKNDGGTVEYKAGPGVSTSQAVRNIARARPDKDVKNV